LTGTDAFNLERFVEAQQGTYEGALVEIRAGKKESHWMWFIFPQLRGLGTSANAEFFGIASLDEARAYLDHPVLGARLRECVETLLSWTGRLSAEQIFGRVDALKLRSSLTLFEQIEAAGPFDAALAAFFAGERDQRTLALLNGQR
jgi:uncharacterized protein (DUF1810 family)